MKPIKIMISFQIPVGSIYRKPPYRIHAYPAGKHPALSDVCQSLALG
jgi:hypothetical protein